MNRNNNNDNGFIAITIVLIISGILFALISYSSLESATFFDQALHKEYRTMNHYYAFSCIDQAILMLAHDYFFETIDENEQNEIIDLPDFHCQILEVKKVGNIREILVVGNYKSANVYRHAKVKLNDSNLEIMEIE